MMPSIGTSPPVATERLSLRPLTPDDAAEVQCLTDDPSITDAISFLKSPFTRADAEALIAQRGERDCPFGIRQRADGFLVGYAGAHLRGETEIEVGYWIAARSHGQGYATEALQALVAMLANRYPGHRIIAECRPENGASWRVLEKAGFQPMGAAGQRPGRQVLALASLDSIAVDNGAVAKLP